MDKALQRCVTKGRQIATFVDNSERERLQKERLEKETVINGICLLYIDQMLNGTVEKNRLNM